MKKVAFALLIGAVAIPSAVSAQTYDHYGNRIQYDRYGNRTDYYQGGHHYYRHHCGGGNGAVGTVAGGVGGALIGNAIGGGAAGTVLGGVGGALLGRHLDKEHTRDRNGC